jgi:hypothetical protein
MRRAKGKSKVKIGGHEYSVKFQEDLARNHDAAGMSCANKLVIILEKRGKKSHVNEVFWHEVIEQINYQHELSLPHNTITTLGCCIQQVLTDNPEIVKEFSRS